MKVDNVVLHCCGYLYVTEWNVRQCFSSSNICLCFLLQLLSAASQFQLGLLQRHCELICSQHINLDNAVSIYKTAKVTHTHTGEPGSCHTALSAEQMKPKSCVIQQSCSYVTKIILSFSQAHGSVELSSFCEGYFLQQMPALLEREGFRSLLLGPPGTRQGNTSTSTLVHSRGDSPLEELEASLAQRLRSLHVTSRVWGQQDSCCGE